MVQVEGIDGKKPEPEVKPEVKRFHLLIAPTTSVKNHRVSVVIGAKCLIFAIFALILLKFRYNFGAKFVNFFVGKFFVEFAFNAVFRHKRCSKPIMTYQL